ncbi:hypothetical protein C8R43DRAFT_488880 [Mycena crocata]|nr:hypothetical protein C8R43DRAFT_488880 [Mycena crocata]
MLEELDSRDEEQLILLEEEFRDLTLKEAEIFEQLTEVRAAKQRVRRLVAEKKNRYASIFKLPDELLVCIVEAGQQSSALASAPIEVLASHVSQQFRWAVIGAPSLWSSIELHWGVESEEARFAAYLDRAQACLLSVTLKYSAYGGKEDCDYDQIRNELTTVAKHISRIRQLVLQCGGLGLSFDDAITHFCDLYAPCLEYVDISSLVSEVEPLEEDPYASIFNGGAPCLKTLKLSNIYPECQTPWMPSLTILDLRGMHSPLVAALIPTILFRCPQLVDVTLDGSTFFVIDPPAIGPILMASLRSLRGLRLDSDRSDALITGIVPIITAPALQVLQFSGVHGTQISTFFNLLPPSRFPALRSLTFANSSVRCKDCHHPPERIQPQALRHFIGLASLTMVNICHTTVPLAAFLRWAASLYDTRIRTILGKLAGPNCNLGLSLRPMPMTLYLRFEDCSQLDRVLTQFISAFRGRAFSRNATGTLQTQTSRYMMPNRWSRRWDTTEKMKHRISF